MKKCLLKNRKDDILSEIRGHIESMKKAEIEGLERGNRYYSEWDTKWAIDRQDKGATPAQRKKVIKYNELEIQELKDEITTLEWLAKQIKSIPNCKKFKGKLPWYR